MGDVATIPVIFDEDDLHVAYAKLYRKAEMGRFTGEDLRWVFDNVERYVTCPRCQAGPFTQCVTRHGKRTGTHVSRWVATKEAMTGIPDEEGGPHG